VIFSSFPLLFISSRRKRFTLPPETDSVVVLFPLFLLGQRLLRDPALREEPLGVKLPLCCAVAIILFLLDRRRAAGSCF